jgi:hypothetical protein
MSRTAPVANLYLLNASVRATSFCARHLSRRNWPLTGGEQDQGGSGVDNTGRGREDCGGTVLNGLVDTPVLVGWVSHRGGAIQSRVSNEILQSELSDHGCLHVCN